LEGGIFQDIYVGAFFLQEKGIIKRMKGDLEGALSDLTAAIARLVSHTVRSKRPSGYPGRSRLLYNCWKHRGYVQFLMGDLKGAAHDGKMALDFPDSRSTFERYNQYHFRSVWNTYYLGNTFSLGNTLIEYMHFNLHGTYQLKAITGRST
jgi:hypothetical protein